MFAVFDIFGYQEAIMSKVERDTSMIETVSEARAIRHLPDLLNRVHVRGERFVIERDGEAVAELSPPKDRPHTFGALLGRIAGLPRQDPDFARDLQDIHERQPPQSEGRWDS